MALCSYLKLHVASFDPGMATDVYLRREAAINALLSLIPNVRPLNYERSQFEIALTGQLHSLRLCV